MNDSNALQIATELARIRRVLEQISATIAGIANASVAIANRPR